MSFEMVRSLIERLPVLVMPKWVRVPAQPIFIRDVLKYLLAAMDLPDGKGRVYEIGGADVVSYSGLMREYARQRGLKRWMIPVPVLSPRLSSLWLGLVTPVFARVGRKLIDSIRHSTVVRDPAALAEFGFKPVGVTEAIAGALRREDARYAETRWSDALSAAGDGRNWGGTRFGNRLVDSRTTTVGVKPAAAFAAIERIGGDRGWYYAQALWRVRGWLDLLIGGVGMRRGRKNPDRLHAGDVVDCWRVENIERGGRLRLSAEMKLPGRAWLEFEVQPGAEGATSLIRQTAIFDPLGVAGLAYWYGIWPLHQLVFAGMLRSIKREAEGRG